MKDEMNSPSDNSLAYFLKPGDLIHSNGQRLMRHGKMKSIKKPVKKPVKKSSKKKTKRIKRTKRTKKLIKK
jgi:hypothetical protein